MHLGPLTLRLDPVALRALSETLSEAVLAADFGPLRSMPHASAS